MEAYAVEAENLYYKYDDAPEYTVKGISLKVKKGEFVCILGRNGSGKSTLGKLINLLYTPGQGEVKILGRAAQTPDEAYELRSMCGMVFQDPDNQMVATIVEEDVAFGCENLGIEPNEIQARVKSALETVGMTEYSKSAPHMLSGGQKQRIAIAGIIAMNPQIIIFDESTSMLDPIGRNEIFGLAKKLNASGTTVIWITHFMDEAAQSDRLIVIDEGKIAMEGKPGEVFSQVKKVKSFGLEVPDMTYLAGKLIERGVNLRPDILSIDEMEVELCRLASKI